MNPSAKQKRVAYYGGTFDPPHGGHLKIARTLVRTFDLDEFVFIPAFHAPHKPDVKPTSAYHRYAMLCLATADEPHIAVSLMEIETGEKRYSLDTLTRLTSENVGNAMYFVMGADSWKDITTWHEWETVLLLTNHIIVSRPGYEIGFDHVTSAVRKRIVDLRNMSDEDLTNAVRSAGKDSSIFITNAVHFDISATEIREDVREDDILDRAGDVPVEVAKYIEKYELYR